MPDPIVSPVSSPARPFPIPTGAQVSLYLQRNSVQGPSPMQFWAIFTVFIAVGLIVFTASEGQALIIPLLLVVGLMAYLSWKLRYTRDIEARSTQIQELAMLRRWSDSLALAWRMLPSLRSMPEQHARAIVLIAHDLDQLRYYEAAIAAYDHLIERLPSESAASLHLRAQRAMAMLADDRLSDADRAIRLLKPDSTMDATPVAGAVMLARLMQSTVTGHAPDVVSLAPTALATLSPLGVEAAYGYAMIAGAYLQLSRKDSIANDAPMIADLRHYADLWWKRATTLMSPTAIVQRHHELTPLLEVAARLSPMWDSPTPPVSESSPGAPDNASPKDAPPPAAPPTSGSSEVIP